MQRVMIIGAPGSGKSTLARSIGERTGLPVQHIDHIHYLSGWVDRVQEDKLALLHEVQVRERWIIEGGISETWAARAARADTLIWLDRPVGIRLRRVLARSWHYRGSTRPDLPDGCPERFNAQTYEFFKYIWRTRKRSRVKMEKLFVEARPEQVKHRLTSDGAVAEFLANL